jgi:hypothetical protein
MKTQNFLTHEKKDKKPDADLMDQYRSISLEYECCRNLDSMKSASLCIWKSEFSYSDESDGDDESDSIDSDLDEMTAEVNHAYAWEKSKSPVDHSIYSCKLDEDLQRKECAQTKHTHLCYMRVRDDFNPIRTAPLNGIFFKSNPMQSTPAIFLPSGKSLMLKFREIANEGLTADKHFILKKVTLAKPKARQVESKEYLKACTRLNNRLSNYRFNRDAIVMANLSQFNAMQVSYYKERQSSDRHEHIYHMPYALVSKTSTVKPMMTAAGEMESISIT